MQVLRSMVVSRGDFPATTAYKSKVLELEAAVEVSVWEPVSPVWGASRASAAEPLARDTHVAYLWQQPRMAPTVLIRATFYYRCFFLQEALKIVTLNERKASEGRILQEDERMERDAMRKASLSFIYATARQILPAAFRLEVQSI